MAKFLKECMQLPGNLQGTQERVRYQMKSFRGGNNYC